MKCLKSVKILCAYFFDKLYIFIRVGALRGFSDKLLVMILCRKTNKRYKAVLTNETMILSWTINLVDLRKTNERYKSDDEGLTLFYWKSLEI